MLSRLRCSVGVDIRDYFLFTQPSQGIVPILTDRLGPGCLRVEALRPRDCGIVTGIRETRVLQVNRARQVCPDEVGALEVSAFEIDAVEIRVHDPGLEELGTAEVGLLHTFGFPQPRAAGRRR